MAESRNLSDVLKEYNIVMQADAAFAAGTLKAIALAKVQGAEGHWDTNNHGLTGDEGAAIVAAAAANKVWPKRISGDGAT